MPGEVPLSPEEMGLTPRDLEMQTSRTLETAKLMKGGAELVADEGAKTPRLEVTKRQLGEAENEMNQDLIERGREAEKKLEGLKEAMTFILSTVDAIEKAGNHDRIAAREIAEGLINEIVELEAQRGIMDPKERGEKMDRVYSKIFGGIKFPTLRVEGMRGEQIKP